jgi:hypothetical protein
MDSIWFKFSVETMVTNGHGRKVRRKSQGENRRGSVTRKGKPGLSISQTAVAPDDVSRLA